MEKTKNIKEKTGTNRENILKSRLLFLIRIFLFKLRTPAASHRPLPYFGYVRWVKFKLFVHYSFIIRSLFALIRTLCKRRNAKERAHKQNTVSTFFNRERKNKKKEARSARHSAHVAALRKSMFVSKHTHLRDDRSNSTQKQKEKEKVFSWGMEATRFSKRAAQSASPRLVP